jgi:hypothetical protein
MASRVGSQSKIKNQKSKTGEDPGSSPYMRKDEFGHFKQGDLIASIEDFPEFVIGVDEHLVGGILQVMRADVNPEAPGDFSS